MEQRNSTIEQELEQYIEANVGIEPDRAAFALMNIFNAHYLDPVGISDGIVYIDDLLDNKEQYSEEKVMLLESTLDGLIWFMTECLCGQSIN